MITVPRGLSKIPSNFDGSSEMTGDSSGLVPQIEWLEWSGPAQRGWIEADPFVMWVAITFVTIVVILYFFLRGVKRPKAKSPKKSD